MGMALPGVLGVNHVAMGLAQMLLTIAIMVINQRFFCQWIQKFVAAFAKYGHVSCARCQCSFLAIVCMRYLRWRRRSG